MIQFVPYSPTDLTSIELQPAQEKWRDQFFLPGYAQSLDIKGMAWTAMDGEKVLGCAGFAPQWEGRVIGWAVFGREIPRRAWPRILRKIRREMHNSLADHGRHRLEITVPRGFDAGCRLAHLLGFEVEGLMKEYGPDGGDHFLYAQVIPCAQQQ
jgi:hypothetical protein